MTFRQRIHVTKKPSPASTAPDQTRSPEKLDVQDRKERTTIPFDTETTAKMFKKDIVPSTKSKVKSSVQRGLRQNFLDSYPGFEPYIEEFMPKKAQLDSIKLPEKSTLYTVDNKPLFYQPQDGPPIPHLKLVHAYPTALPTVQIDRGAIRFVLSGAALMAPGLTSPGGRLPEADSQVEEGGVVAVMAEGKELACLVGTLKVGTEEIKSKGKGVVLDEGHFLGDGLWKMPLD